jgi:L-serine deaminase
MIGLISTILGDQGINIGQMSVGQEKDHKRNIILMNTDVPVSDDILEKIQGLDNVFSARRIEL